MIAIYFSLENAFGPTAQGYSAELAVNKLLSTGLSTSYYSYASIAAFTGPFAGIGTPLTSLSLVGGGDVLTTGSLPFNGSTNTFTLTQKVVITQTGGSSQVTATLAGVPDGGSTIALLGVSLLGIGVIRRKLMK